MRLTSGENKQDLSRGRTAELGNPEATVIENIGSMQLHVIHVRVERFHDNDFGEFPKEMR